MMHDPFKTDSPIRRYSLNMPQMALSGLSESWLFKETGDLHWSMLVDGLGVRSSEIEDETGERLYATFCRVRIQSTAPLSAFAENEAITIDGAMTRYGRGIFFSELDLAGEGKSIRATVMSSFSKRGAPESNVDLVKAGLPKIADDCPIAALREMPDFGIEYNERRNRTPETSVFECGYDINPYQDINGVGLLYFAAYQSISDICELEFMNKGIAWAQAASTIERDICYFANSDVDEKLIYRIHSQRDTSSGVEIESSLSRSSDGVVMASIITQKALKGR